MADTLFLQLSAEEQRAAWVRDGRLCELQVERIRGRTLAGNVYRARVERIAAEIDCAFLAIGEERQAMLPAAEVVTAADLPPRRRSGAVPGGEEGPSDEPSAESGAPPPRPKRPIGALLRVGQELLVQVVREPVARKGPRVTMHVGLPGRNIVLLPTQPHVGISKMVDDPAERDRLFRLLKALLPPGMGAIARTVGDHATEAEIGNDVAALRALWDDILQRYAATSAPSLLHTEPDLALRAIRDLCGADTEAIWIDAAEERARLDRYLATASPALRTRLRLHDQLTPLFVTHGLDVETRRALEPRVALPSGGEIVIERTEAMTVIDVNSAQASSEGALSDVILAVNLEAAREVARQLRLRSIGGICVVDFIDMRRAEDRHMLEAVLESELRDDPARVTMTRMSRFGLVILVRKRVRESLYERLSEPCPTCQGRGHVRAASDLALETLRRLRALAASGAHQGSVVQVEAPPRVAAILSGELADTLADLGRAHGVVFRVTAGLQDPEAAPRVSSRGQRE